MESRLFLAGSGSGLEAVYYDNENLTGSSVRRVDAVIAFDWRASSPVPGITPNTFSARWTGQVQPLFTELYEFHTTSNDGVRLWVNGRELVDDWRLQPATENSGRIALTAGQKYDLRMEYFQKAGTALVKLEWSSPRQQRQVVPTSQLYPLAALPGEPFSGTHTTSQLPRMNLATAKASDVLNIPNAEKGSWFGRTVSGSDVLRMYTYGGDADLSGTITAKDYFRIDNGYLNKRTGWSNGDFDHDGTVTINDYFLIDNNWLLSKGEPQVTPDQGPPVSQSDKWQLVFRDEFSGTAIDPVWHTTQYWGHDHTVVGGDELQAYDPTGASVRNGVLRLTARPDNEYGVPYVSGLVQTGGDETVSGEPKFSFLHGYLEVRAKLPLGQGLWPAFWMMPASHNDDNGELDVLEVLGGDPTRANFAVHRDGLLDDHEWVGPDFTKGFHTFGVDWQADHVIWYVDGIEKARTTNPALICPEAMYPILDLATGGWDGPPDSSTPFPSSMDV
ncbi:MAG TPA: PA14 domain-containing protein, partial [Planctomycetaceae bacterium]|nr:PA14 domain-containing protein [Planctomycetaceae bacterium]